MALFLGSFEIQRGISQVGVCHKERVFYQGMFRFPKDSVILFTVKDYISTAIFIFIHALNNAAEESG